MIGEDYFNLRSELSAQLHSLAEVIHDYGRNEESLAITHNLIASLREPFVFVVVGEVNVGKSTFLNALFGQDFSRTGVMPTTDKILFFKYGQEQQVVPITPTLDEVHVPSEVLKDFHIVDTPGTNSIENEHQEITERFVPIADLVIFVFSAMNPWGASAWQFLDKVHKHWMRHVVFVLQQCDLRSTEEIQVITDYMGQLSRQRYGQEFPLFPVSAKKAYLARSSGLDRERLLADSGFQALESHISGLVGRNLTRLNKLSSTVRIGRQLLETVREQMTQSTQQAHEASTMIQEFLTERELQVERTLKKILPALDATEREYHDACVQMAELVDEALSTRRAFQNATEEETAIELPKMKTQSLDYRLFQELQHRSGDRWRQVGIILEEDYLQYDRFVHLQGRGSLFPADAPLPTETDGEQRRRFAVHVDHTLRRFVLSLHLDEGVAPGLARARKRARWVPWLAVPVALGIALAWYIEGPLGAGIAAGGGVLLVGAAFLITQAALNQTKTDLIDRLERSTSLLREMLLTQVQQDVEALFARFLPLLTPAQTQADAQEALMNQQAHRVESLVQSLRAFEMRLRT